jgi:hypothetical protein
MANAGAPFDSQVFKGDELPPEQVVSEIDLDDGSRAVEVQALYRGVVLRTRHLTDPGAAAKPGQARVFGAAGALLLALALALFAHTVRQVSRERFLFDRHLAAGKDEKAFDWKARRPADDFVLFGSVALGLGLVYVGLMRRAQSDPHFVVGTHPNAEAPVAPEYIGGGAFALVTASGRDFVVNVTPQMSGEVMNDNQVIPLRQFVQQRGARFSLPDRGWARIDCGDSTFLVSATPRPRPLETPFLTWRWSEQVYTVATGAAFLLMVLMASTFPPDSSALSLDQSGANNRFLGFLIKPPEEKYSEPVEFVTGKNHDEQGGTGKRHQAGEGKMGSKTSRKRQGLYALDGPRDNRDPHLARRLAEQQARNAGILGVLAMNEGSHLASIFGREDALGNDPTRVLGGLVGTRMSEAYGAGGLGLAGDGWGGAGTGERTIGLGNLGTIGKGGRGDGGAGYGRRVGRLGIRETITPDVTPGVAEVRGSLDKEIIRRIIRHHLNEVKYCYDQELMKHPELGGRLSVRFIISPAGQVMSAVLQSSTIGNVRVESCTVQALRRWEFPRPLGGGIVIVSYPFVFTLAGAGAD